MNAKVKSSVFIDALHLELTAPVGQCLRAVLKDDLGVVQSTVEKDMAADNELFTWTGLNDLPYGKYTLELSQGEDEPNSYRVRMQLVKRV